MYGRPQGSKANSKDTDTPSGSSSEAALAGAAGSDEIVVAQADTLPQDSLVFERVESDSFDTSTITQRFTAASGLVVPLPDGATIARILIVGNDLVIVASDGSVLFVEGGAASPPSIQIGDLTLPNEAVTAAIQNVPETVPAAGPDGGTGAPGSSGNSFVTPEGNIASEFDLVDLLGFSDFVFGLAEDEEREFLEEDTVPIFLGADVVTVEEDDLNQGLGIKYRFLTKKYAKKFWDRIENGEKDGVSFGNNEDGSIDAFTAMGNLNIDFQDDGPAAVDPIVFTPGQNAPAGLTSDGLPLTYEISADGLTLRALKSDGDGGTITVFEVVIDPNAPGGKYTFTLLDNIDHLPTQEGEELLNLGFSVTATDGDGSAVVGSFNVNIQDDVPILLTKELLKELWEKKEEEEEEEQEPPLSDDNESFVQTDGEGGSNGDHHDRFFKKLMLRMGKVDEDELNNFDPWFKYNDSDIEGSRGTDAHRYDRGDGSVKAQGSLGVLFGADDGEARSIVFNLDSETDSIQGPDGENGNCLTACVRVGKGEVEEIPLKSKGELVKYVINEDGTMLIGYTGEPPEDPFGEHGNNDDGPFIAARGGYGGDDATRLIFKVALDDDDYGYFKFTLWDQLDHPKTDDPRTKDVEETAFEDTLILKFGFTATDSDGDSLDSELTIKVKDDIPELKCPHREDDWKYWEVISEGNLIENGSFEDYYGNLKEGDGAWDYLADYRVPGWKTGPGNTPIEIQKEVYENDYHGEHELELDSTDNYTAWQKVDTHDCGYYKLTFGYAARPDHDADTNGVEVWWNGELIDTITADGTNDDGFQWQTYSYKLEGNGEHGVLAFRGVGDSDSFGGMIDGVRLVEIRNPYQVLGYVDEDDLYTHLSHGTSPDGDTHPYFGTVSTSGWLTSLVKVGADEVSNYGPYTKGTFSFTDDAVQKLTDMGLTSKGAYLSYYNYGNYILAVDDNGKPGPSLSDRPVFILELTGKGHFKFILKDQLDHDNPGKYNMGPAVEDILKIDFSKIVQVSDFDGDTVVLKDNSFVIKVRDDVPEHTHHKVWGYVNENDLDTYLSHGTSPDWDTGRYGQISTDGYLNKLVKVGADEISQSGWYGQYKKGEFNFSPKAKEKLEDMELTSKGGNLHFQIIGNKILAFVDKGDNDDHYNHHYDRLVFTLEVHENGYFKYTQWDQLDHRDPGPGNMDDAVRDIMYLDFSHIVKFSDFDGDTIILKDGQFVIKVKDDVPETTGKKVWDYVSETDLDERAEYGEVPRVRSTGTSPDEDTRDDGAIEAKGWLTSLVKVGADETGQYGHHGQHKKGDFNLKGDAVQTMLAMALTSQGKDLSYEIDGDTLIGYVNNPYTSSGYSEYHDRTIFTLKVTEDGYYKYVQYDQLDHKDGHGRPIDDLKIDFSKIVKFSDFDGDTIMLDPWSFVIKVGDDEPKLDYDEYVYKSVNEDDIKTSLSVGTDAGHHSRPLKATGDLSKLVIIGADEPAKFSFKSDAEESMAELGLKSQGKALSYEVQGDMLYAYVNANSQFPGYSSHHDRLVFTLEVQHDGDFEYRQYDQLDHIAYLGQQFDQEYVGLSYLEIDFSPIIKVSDFDWDMIMLRNGSFVIKVIDDEPEVKQTNIVVDEDGLPGGNSFGVDDAGVTPPQNEAHGKLNIKIGADEPGKISFADLHNEVVYDTNDNAVKSATHTLVYKWDQSTHMLTGEKISDGTVIFELKINPSNGNYWFTLKRPIDHKGDNKEDDIFLKLPFEVTDYDYDTDDGYILVHIDDDTPLIHKIEDSEIVLEDGGSEINASVNGSGYPMAMGDIDVSFGGDGPGGIRLKDVDFDGYDTELSPGGQKLTGYKEGTNKTEKIFEVSLAPNGEKYTFKLFDEPVSSTEQVTIPLSFSNGFHGDPLTLNLPTGEVKFNGKTFDSSGNPSDSGSSDDIDTHSHNGFGIGHSYSSGREYVSDREGFEATFEGGADKFSFTIDFQRGPSAQVKWKAWPSDGGSPITGTETANNPSGSNDEAEVHIMPGQTFDKILIEFDFQPTGGRFPRSGYGRLEDFSYMREESSGTEFEFQVEARDNDDDKTHGSFTVDILAEEPTTTIFLKIVQDRHHWDSNDQHLLKDLVIEVDGVARSYSVEDSDNVTFSDGDTFRFTGGDRNEGRHVEIRIDDVPLNGNLEISSKYSTSAEADQNDGEGLRFLLDAGTGMEQFANYRTSPLYTGTHSGVTRTIELDYFSNGSINVLSDPIVLDLNGDGASLVSPADGVSFDLDADGSAEQTGWVAPEDGLLAIDLDGSGAIEDGSEVFSENFDEGGHANSLDALASLDDNGDGVIDSEDAAYDDILVWQDANSDGVSQAGELKGLAEHGIESIDLGATAVDIDADGNHVFAEGEFTLDDGTVGSYLAANLGTRALSEVDDRHQRQTAAAEAIAAAIGAVVIIDMMTGDAVATTATVADAPANGEATVSADNSVMYEAADGFSGQDSFTVEVSDGNGGVEIKTVYLDVEDGVVTGSAVAGPDDAVLLGSEAGETLDASGDAAVVSSDGEGEADTVIVGGDGDDVLIGGEGDDTLIGGGGNDTLHGNGGDDTLFGGAGDDELFGGDGEDVLVGGSGANELTGGDDADVFVFTKAALDDGLLDQVLDYSFADGDALDLTALFDAQGGELGDFVEYDAASGDLKVDADGAGGESAKTVANVDTGSGAAADLRVLFTDDGSTESGIV